MSNTNTCEHGPCTCKMDSGDGIENEHGQHFCSEGCAKGEGCICPECGCSMQSIDNEAKPTPGL